VSHKRFPEGWVTTRSDGVPLGHAEGLAPIQNAVGTLTAFATKPHHVALDGAGRNERGIATRRPRGRRMREHRE
jgi:hypothetical protein